MISISMLIISTFVCSQVIEASHIFQDKAEVAAISPFTSTIDDRYVRKKQPYRTAYHFQPYKNWMGGPNGPMEYKGIYHLFYQYNPKGAVWGNIVWGHSVSTDLINWRPLPFALIPGEKYDREGILSGSATILPDGRPAILYTGVDEEQKQVQVLAFPKDLSDRWLRKWVKVPENPLIEPNNVNKINASSFRNPTTAWLGKDGDWRMIVGSESDDKRGLALLFKSKDFVNWTMEDHPLHYADGDGMWEYPDFYPVFRIGRKGVDTSSPYIKPKNVEYVRKVSLDLTRKDYYNIGTYFSDVDVYIGHKVSINDDFGLRHDYGKFYASKSFFDSVKKRRILWGSVNESSPWEYDVRKGWHGLMTVPRAVWLDKSREQLIQWPVKEINQLRKNPVVFSKRILKKGSEEIIDGITASQADVEVSFEIPSNVLEEAEEIENGQSAEHLCSAKGATKSGALGPFGMKVLATRDMTEFTAIFFRIFKIRGGHGVLMCSDQSSSSLDKKNDVTTYGAFFEQYWGSPNENLNLRILIDHSIVESFGGRGRTVMTARVYPTKAVGNHAQLYVFNGGNKSVIVSKLSAWSMKRANIG